MLAGPFVFDFLCLETRSVLEVNPDFQYYRGTLQPTALARLAITGAQPPWKLSALAEAAKARRRSLYIVEEPAEGERREVMSRARARPRP